MALQCGICLSQFKDPVCLPCGHLYCKICISRHVNVAPNRGMTSTCPECRTAFHIAIPDLTYLPEKYHPFISHALRRVYIDASPSNDATAIAAAEIIRLKDQVASMHARIAHKAKNEEVLLRKCESLQAAVHAHRTGEADAHERAQDLEEKLEDLESEFTEYVGSSRARIDGAVEEGERLKRENRRVMRMMQQMEERLAESEARRIDVEHELYNCRHRHRSDEDNSASSSPYASPSTSRDISYPRLHSAVWGPQYSPSHNLNKDWQRHENGSPTPASGPSGSATGERIIRPLPRRHRVTRSRDDDSVVSGSTKRARVRG